MAVCGLSLAAGSASGADAEVGQVVVTATRNEMNISDVPQSTSVISREEIANGPDRTLPEVIQRVTGIQVIQNGPLGSVSTAQIRGSESGQVLIMINGRRINDAQSGMFDLSNLPVTREDVERIEVLRGGASALYGADAMGGVINIITRAPSREPHAQAAASFGEFRTREYTLTHRWKPGAFGYGLSISRQESLGFRPNSDFRAWVLGGELGYELAPGSELAFSVRTKRKEIGTPGRIGNPDPDDRLRDRLTQLELTYRTRVGSSVNLALRGFRNFYRNTFDQGTRGLNAGPAASHDNDATGWDLQATVAAGDSHLLTAGGEAIHDGVDSSALGAHQATRGALFLQDEIEVIRPLTATLGLRYDHHSVFQDQFDPRAGLLLRLPWDTRLRASVARSYRAPTFDDLYWPEDAFASGNPSLKPERAWSYELGAEKRCGRLAFVKAAGFYRSAKDLIRWAEGPDGKWRPSNIESATIWGAEAELTLYPLKGLVIPLNYAFLHPRDEGTGKAIPKKPKHVVNAAVEYTLARAESGVPFGLVSSVRGRYVQFYLDDTSKLNREYLVIDARVAFEFAIHRELKGEAFVSLNNVLNRDYQIAEGYPMPPRSLNGGVSFSY
jgi:outer membrane receptor for ferrienterochelin and colicins